MKTIDKNLAYASLTQIKENKNININKYINEMAGKETIPYNVLTFINKHYPIEQLEVYNKIYNSRKNNPLYKNLVNENLAIEEMIISLNSLLTQTFIKSKDCVNKGKKEDAKIYFDIMNSNIILESLQDYINNNNEELLKETFYMVREVFKKLYK